MPCCQDSFEPLQGQALKGFVLVREEDRRGAHAGEGINDTANVPLDHFPVGAKQAAPEAAGGSGGGEQVPGRGPGVPPPW